ncbi:hypothetical protein PR048_012759 [Dryococelus australis]|uniref:Uncharacterized protein n=1 Tax=Dryococelus australis TaxID=614101 RepID=A0ABQ9HQ99_9NEOP|nr:hypothetical protein PR048_012759 [Dryococelus australis]
MSQWFTVFTLARSNRNRNKKVKKPLKERYLVKELKFDEFKDYKDLGSKLIENRNKDLEGKTVHYRSQGSYQELIYEKLLEDLTTYALGNFTPLSYL